MIYQNICISSGHSDKCQGAIGPSPWGLNEVAEAKKTMAAIADELRARGVHVETFSDTTSTTQDQNLQKICNWHNGRPSHQLDISVHFNSTDPQPTKAVGVEVFYYSQSELADDLSEAIATALSLPDRGGKDGTGLYFLSHTNAPAVLLEICFVNSHPDVDAYHQHFARIAPAVADVLAGPAEGARPPVDRPPVIPPAPDATVLFRATGTCSWFGGPEDMGVSPSEGLAFIYDIDTVPHLFLPTQPAGTTGLARRLNPYVHFIACRWDYAVTPKTMLAESGQVALVRNVSTGMELSAIPADWGPHEEQTGRAADLSRSLLEDLGLETDDEVEVIYPAP